MLQCPGRKSYFAWPFVFLPAQRHKSISGTKGPIGFQVHDKHHVPSTAVISLLLLPMHLRLGWHRRLKWVAPKSLPRWSSTFQGIFPWLRWAKAVATIPDKGRKNASLCQINAMCVQPGYPLFHTSVYLATCGLPAANTFSCLLRRCNGRVHGPRGKIGPKVQSRTSICVCRGRYSYEHWELSHPRAHVISTAAPRIFGAGLEVSLAGKTSTRDDKSMNACVQGVKGTQELKSIPRFGSLR